LYISGSINLGLQVLCIVKLKDERLYGGSMNWLECTGKGKAIAIIDSGVDISRKELSNSDIKLLNDCEDKVGHGTAVTTIIAKIAPNASLYCYSLFEKDGVVSTEDLINILESITLNHFFDIIHLSCGVLAHDIPLLYSVCKKITDSGTIMIAAYDNEGVVSYPAVFDNVIGVDWSRYCSDGMEYYFVEGSPINILGLGAMQYLPWKNGEYKYVAGASFAAPYITGIVARMLEARIPPIDIVDTLKKSSRDVICIHNEHYCPDNQELKIQKAILFPYNKEIQTLSVYEELLTFQVEGIYDLPCFRNVGRYCKDIIQYGDSERIIESYKDIKWEDDFDTVILGHVDIVSRIVNKDILKTILEMCIKYEKNIYAFDDLRPYNELINIINGKGQFAYFPKTDKRDINKTLMGKLYSIETPVVAIFGTSSSQGKFSLQLMIRKKMQLLGYKVGGLGTEPSSLLFGIDRVYPIGYGSVSLSGLDAIETINRYMHEVDQKNYDIIVTGSQSFTVPYNMGNSAHYPLAQHELLIGTSPDVVILCINPYDDYSFVDRTIRYLSSYLYTKVLALVMFPKCREREWAIQGKIILEMDKNDLEQRKHYYEDKSGLRCYIAGDESEIDQLIENIIDYLCEE